MKLGDLVFISPDITSMKEWIKAQIIDIEDNPFSGIIISAKAEDGEVFFGRNEYFKPTI